MNMGLLDIYSDYLISQNGYATATGLSSMLDGQISHDKITRFLNTGFSTSKNLWLYVKPTLRKIEQSRGGVLIIDDSIEEKPYTDENELVNWHYSHAKHRCIKGINLMSCLVRYDDTALPVAFEAIRKNIRYINVKTKKRKDRLLLIKMSFFALWWSRQ